MTKINLRNINFINKSCFTNCSGLKELYCSDFLTFIGEWAFAYCSSLKEVSIYKDTILDKNIFSNCNAKLMKRRKRSNYVIESDNIYSLKSFQLSLKGKVGSILIDPPYNSHIDYIGYKDGDYLNYHDFIKQRLVLAYNLLSNKGFLVINIDEGEVNNLYSICKDIFGEMLVSIHKWKKIHPYFDTNRVVLNPNKKQTDFEYIIICQKSFNSILKKIKQPYIVNNELKEKEIDVPEIFDCFGTTSSAKDEINELFGRRDYFSTPKPVKLIKELLRATSKTNSIALDFFAGSGTLAQATIELNKDDGGKRHYIMISNSESNICKNVTLKRAQMFDKRVVYLK